MPASSKSPKHRMRAKCGRRFAGAPALSLAMDTWSSFRSIASFRRGPAPLRDDVRRRPDQSEIRSEGLERSPMKIRKMILHPDAIFGDDQTELPHDSLARRSLYTAVGRHPSDDKVRQPSGTEKLIEPGTGEGAKTMLGDYCLSRLRREPFDEFCAPRPYPTNFRFVFLE